MDTSDSEYFESADEDFNSDSETEKPVHNVIEPELCKLKISGQNKDFTGKDPNSVETGAHGKNRTIDKLENEKISSDSVVKDELDNFLSSNIEDFSTSLNNTLETKLIDITNLENMNKDSNVKIEQSEALKQAHVEKSTLIVKEEKTEAPKADDKKPTLGVKEKKCDVVKKDNGKFTLDVKDALKASDDEKSTLIIKEEKSEAPKADDEKLLTLQKKEEKREVLKADNEKFTLGIKEEENLWEDDEIDWGSETIKEESNAPAKSIKVKEENDGWEEFDAEWERTKPDHHPQPQKTRESSSNFLKNPKLSKEENLWNDDDDWEPIEKPEEKQNQSEVESSGWSGWGNWGVSSILNTATQSVSTLTSHVSQGISTVLESGMGIPDPEELARINKLDKETTLSNNKLSSETSEEPSSTPVAFNLGHLVSGVSQLTKFVETTGSKVITGGLDTLEAIGKKTAEVLQEGDPGLKKKRALLKLDSGKPNLSQILREAKERAEQENELREQKHLEVKKYKNYETLFDDHQGLVHLEALEMISKLCSIKLDNLKNSLHPSALQDLEETLEQIKELCELPEDDDEEKISLDNAKETIENAVKEINVPILYHKLFSICEETEAWLQNVNIDHLDATDLHQQGIEALAHVTALAVEQFHKCGELLLVKDHRSTADEADSLAQITTTIKLIIVTEASKFTEKMGLRKHGNTDKINEYITNIFYEAANSGRYIQDAFQLLIPVLQVGAI